MKFVVTKLNGHATHRWDGVQVERIRLSKWLIKNWNKMVTKLRGNFLPGDYQLSLFRQMQNLRHRFLTVKEYTEDFYKVNIRDRQIQDTEEKVERYINGIRMEIQDEMSTMSLKIVDEAYQMELKVEEKLEESICQRKRYF